MSAAECWPSASAVTHRQAGPGDAAVAQGGFQRRALAAVAAVVQYGGAQLPGGGKHGLGLPAAAVVHDHNRAGPVRAQPGQQAGQLPAGVQRGDDQRQLPALSV